MATITGTNASNNLNGTNLADQIFGLGGNDILIGFDGDDVLVGGAGADQLFGSSGFDVASYATSTAGVYASLLTFETFGGDAEGDSLYSIEGLIGSAQSDTFLGDDTANRLQGGGGNDNLWGEGGDDTILGGAGNDEVFGGAGADHLDGGDGVDTAIYVDATAGVSVSLAGGVAHGSVAEGDTLTGVENLIGWKFADVLTGNGAANYLVGNDGNDTIAGGAGDDRIRGGSGMDRLDGGSGIDTLDYSDQGVAVGVSLASGLVLEGSGQTDTITGFENLIGSNLGDFLIGSNGANVLQGGLGNDLLEGGLGRDELTGGGGADRFRFNFTTESGKTTATRDVVHDFHHGEGDHLDFSQMDGSTSRAGDQDFTFIGSKAFTAEGQVRSFLEGDHTVVEVNTAGSSGADMQLQLDGHVGLSASDFFFID